MPLGGKLDIATNTYVLNAICLRLQVNPENKNEFQGLSAERGFADFIFAHLVLHIVVINFIG
ncbi:Dolichyl-diphosphooligosaccharide--protein glycosyltransferase subunit DAD1 [Papilio machaon]|uniref:Dolichyl-diphosphooligosaccharide--protein glycosyltransferase subunit DAD1 n=1 Tax=Papilio machaon TaxID=76193 RepID=A0A194QYL3_PAPMA|nr:Dolichyl-diphosphooligosaccharide--protein glycosyltransferase subunit DAD1 [Papilio machaon]